WLPELTPVCHLCHDTTRVGDAGLAHLKSTTRLVQLTLNGTRVTDDGLALLRELPCRRSLQTLHLASLPITDEGLSHLRDFERLEILNLSDTRVTDDGLRHVARL